MTNPFASFGALRDRLRGSYARDEWLRELLPGLFQTVELGAKPTALEVPTADWASEFEASHWLGRVRLLGDDGVERVMWVAELRLRNPNRLQARVSLRRGLSRLFSAGQVEAVLAFFVGADGADYRVTFAAAEWALDGGRVVKSETPPKRYSFVIGPGEPGTTAAQRLFGLHEQRAARRFDDVRDAFSVERLNKTFFDGYRTHHKNIVRSLATKAATRVFGLESPTDAEEMLTEPGYKPARDFVKRMMGRIVFLYFVQRKGWLGADPSAKPGEYIGGDKRYVRNVLAARGSANVYSGALAPLFFEVLNTDRTAQGDVCRLSSRRVPYLNSGLFEPEGLRRRARMSPIEQHMQLELNEQALIAFFDFLDEFNFTVDENSPDEGEVGVDPEMLGHIFENLLEDNRERGTFYTPKAVVEFMCKESVLRYLSRRLGERPELERLVRSHDVGNWNDDKNWVKKHAADIVEALTSVRVCDPAVGSGAFPMGMLNEIFWLRYSLRPVREKELGALKKSIIQDNLCGVDLDKNAVEIARLRFWLSIIVDATTPEPLPNLEFRFLQGDSLVDLVGGHREWAQRHLPGVSMAHDSSQQAELGLVETSGRASAYAREQRRIRDLIASHFSLHGEPKAELAREIEAAEKAFVLDVLRHVTEDLERMPKSAKVRAQLDMTRRRIDRLKSAEDGDDRDYFPWLFYEDRQFDIVIANPPYISAIDHGKVYGEEARKALKETYASAKGAFDVYVCFFELACNQLVDGGVLTFITPNKYLSVDYAQALRDLIRERMKLSLVVDLSSVKVFKEASVYPVVTVLERGVEQGRAVSVMHGRSKLTPDDIVMSELPAADSRWLDALPNRIWGVLLSEHRSVLEKVSSKSRWLGDVANVNAMTTAGEADAFGTQLRDSASGGCRVINTGTIDPFESLWGQKALTKQGAKFLHPVLTLDTETLGNRLTLFRSPKIIVAKIAHRCEAFLDSEGAFGGLDVNCIYAPAGDYTLKFLVGYLHSDVAAFVHRLFFGGLAMSGGYLPFQAPHLRVLPVPHPESKLVARVEMAVDAIVASRDAGSIDLSPVADIDRALAAHFGLTPSDMTAIREVVQREMEDAESRNA